MLTTQGLHTNNNSHCFFKHARFSGTLIQPSVPSSITYDRTLDHTSAGSGLTGRGRGNSGNRTNLPGVRASGLGCRKITVAGVSVYVPARLMCRCTSGVVSKKKNSKKASQIQAGEDEEARRPRDVAIILRPTWTGWCVCRTEKTRRFCGASERLHARETRPCDFLSFVPNRDWPRWWTCPNGHVQRVLKKVFALRRLANRSAKNLMLNFRHLNSGFDYLFSTCCLWSRRNPVDNEKRRRRVATSDRSCQVVLSLSSRCGMFTFSVSVLYYYSTRITVARAELRHGGNKLRVLHACSCTTV